jgi:hypothetical protein
MNNPASEYLPHEPLNGNGNGKAKPFVLSQPKSPEQLRREAVIAQMPELRRNCSRDKRLGKCVGTKWLFGTISDLTFLHRYGGTGDGRVYISVRDLHRIFGVSRQSITLWREKLEAAGWIWYRELWPKAEWGITAVCAQPELFAPNMEFNRQVAKAGGEAQEVASLREKAESADLGQFGHTSEPEVTMEVASLARGSGQSGQQTGPVWPEEVASLGHKTGPVWPEEVASLANKPGQTGPEKRARVARGSGHIKESPGTLKESGGKKGEPPPPEFGEWKKRLKTYFPDRLRGIKADLVNQQKQLDPGDPAVADLSCRIMAVDEALYGGPMPKRKPAGIPAAAAAVKQARAKEPTAEEILAGARYLVSAGKADKLTAVQRDALKRAGE